MMNSHLVTNVNDYNHMMQNLKGKADLGIDTESNSLFAYREQVCLVQVSSATHDFLIDPFPLDGMEELGALFADPGVQKIFHAGDYDIACLKRDYEYQFANLFDTMLAAATLGEANLGLASILEKYLDVSLEKKYQRADWGKRPIKTEMLEYAQGDSHYLIALRDRLAEALRAMGRLELLLEDSEALAMLPAATDPVPDVWHMHGIQGLKPQEMSLLQDLMLLREDLAARLDRPVFKVMGDASLVEIAKAQPRHIQELDLLSTVSERQVRAFGKALMGAISDWRKDPKPVQKRKNHRPSDVELSRRERLSSWRKEQGKAMGVSSNIVLSKDLLDRIAKAAPKDKAELGALMKAYPCRFDLFADSILKTLEKENS